MSVKIIFIAMAMWLFSVTSTFSAIAPANTTSLSRINELDKLFRDLSAEIYTVGFKTKYDTRKLKNIKSLQKITRDLVSKDKQIEAINLIKKHQNLIKKNIDDPSLFSYIDLLLGNNEWDTANNLYRYIEKEGDKSLVSNVKFLFSKYYFNRNKLAKTLGFLDGINEDLSIGDGHYALIMYGITLQNQKKHREAIKYYKKVPKNSTYYQYAQLNLAIVSIRQGWWSDAHIIIRELLKIKRATQTQQGDFINRLYLVLGYSFLQQEYFREARESFRNIRKNSVYANRAMLGISLAAASQGDNVGALNILNILQQQDAQDLSVEETYLLLPYVYEKLGKYKTSSTSYTLALSYYKKRVYEISRTLKEISSLNSGLSNFNIIKNTLVVNKNKINLKKKEQIIFIENFRTLKKLKNKVHQPNLIRKINLLLQKHKTMLSDIILGKLQLRSEYLKSYKNQSQYGLARLYDNSKTN